MSFIGSSPHDRVLILRLTDSLDNGDRVLELTIDGRGQAAGRLWLTCDNKSKYNSDISGSVTDAGALVLNSTSTNLKIIGHFDSKRLRGYILVGQRREPLDLSIERWSSVPTDDPQALLRHTSYIGSAVDQVALIDEGDRRSLELVLDRKGGVVGQFQIPGRSKLDLAGSHADEGDLTLHVIGGVTLSGGFNGSTFTGHYFGVDGVRGAPFYFETVRWSAPPAPPLDKYLGIRAQKRSSPIRGTSAIPRAKSVAPLVTTTSQLIDWLGAAMFFGGPLLGFIYPRSAALAFIVFIVGGLLVTSRFGNSTARTTGRPYEPSGYRYDDYDNDGADGG